LINLAHNLAHAGPLDQAVEQDHERLLILVGELIDLAIEAVQFRVMNLGIVVDVLASGQLVEGDIQDVGSVLICFSASCAVGEWGMRRTACLVRG